MCSALELCQKYQILHRDIKPENIFVSDSGDYKLGDFGVARTMEKTMSGMSKKGTYNYMAPEVYKGEEYGFRADMYSVGIVLYRLLNHNRIPFLPPAPERVTMRDRENALNRRIQGEELPLPCYAQDTLGQMVCKAAAPVPADRYESPAQMRKVLEDMLLQEKDDTPVYPDSKEQKKRQDASRSVERSVNTSATPNMSVTPNMSDVQHKASEPKMQAVPQQYATEEEVWEDETEKTSSAFDPRRKDPGKSIKMPEGKDVKQSQPKVEDDDDDKTVSAFAATKKRSVAANTAVKPAKKKSPLPLILIALVAVIGIVAVFALGGGGDKPSSNQGGSSNDQISAEDLTMLDKWFYAVDEIWNKYIESLSISGNAGLDYSTNSFEEIKNMLADTEFQHVGPNLNSFKNESAALNILVEDKNNGAWRELTFAGDDYEFTCDMGAAYYAYEKSGNGVAVLPEYLCIGVTTLKDLGITDEMLDWILHYKVTEDRNYYKELGNTWSALVDINEWSGEENLKISLSNKTGTQEEMYLSFKKYHGEWTLTYVFAAFAVKADEKAAVTGMTYTEFCQAGFGDNVEVVGYVQAKSEWIYESYMTVFAQNEDGAYYVSGLECTKEEYDQLVPGSKIYITGIKDEWADAVAISEASYQLLDGKRLDDPLDVTTLLEDSSLVQYQNRFVSFKGMTVYSIRVNGQDAAYAYKWDGSGQEGDELYFELSLDGKVYTFMVNPEFCDETTDVYQAVKQLKIGDVVDVEGFLYWYSGANPWVTGITVR